MVHILQTREVLADHMVASAAIRLTLAYRQAVHMVQQLHRFHLVLVAVLMVVSVVLFHKMVLVVLVAAHSNLMSAAQCLFQELFLQMVKMLQLASTEMLVTEVVLAAVFGFPIII